MCYRIILMLMLFFLTTLSYAKTTDLTKRDVSLKTSEMLKNHIKYKELSPLLVERILQNFFDELDPSKCYMIQPEIEKWISPSKEMKEKILDELNKENFQEFEAIYNLMVKSIERRNSLENVIKTLPMEVIQKDEIKDEREIKWVKSENELQARLLKIRSLQFEAFQKLKDNNTELFFKLVNKKRLHREAELVKDKNSVLVYVLKAIASSLDAHTQYFTPQETQQFVIALQQKLCGIGVQLRDNLNGLLITRIIDGGPAAKNNKLKADDTIIAVNHEPIVGMDIADSIELIRGEKGTKVTLTILRDKDNFDLELIRGEVIFEEGRYEYSFEPYGDGVIAYVRIFSFYQDKDTSTARDVKKIINNLKEEYNVKGVILDLRGNSGGLLPQAVDICSLFINKGIVVSVQYNTGFIQHLRNVDGRITWDGPLLVLIDKGSASASEIVAQTLQDYGRAIVVGDPYSFGKGSFQSFTYDAVNDAKINPKGELKVTRGLYYTVSGRSPQLVGVKSDIVIPGLFSEMNYGEKFAKFPLENTSIPSNFIDSLSDILPEQKKQVEVFYNHNLQQKIEIFTKHLDLLEKNSKNRISSNKNWQKFLKELKEKKFEGESIEVFGHGDFQLVECYNVMKDLIFFLELEQKYAVCY